MMTFTIPLESGSVLFFFSDPPTTEIYTLSLHDALPISRGRRRGGGRARGDRERHADAALRAPARTTARAIPLRPLRSEEHTSELQSHSDLVCRLLLEKKNHTRTAARPCHVIAQRPTHNT